MLIKKFYSIGVLKIKLLAVCSTILALMWKLGENKTRIKYNKFRQGIIDQINIVEHRGSLLDS